MADDAAAAFDAARAEAYSTPLDRIDVSLQDRFVTNTFWPFFERLRREDPVHYCAESEFGPYWSVTRFNDIVEVETHHGVFSSEGAISIYDPADDDMQMPNFIAMDPPKHDQQRKTIAPIVSSDNLTNFAPLIRSRAAKILDELPIGEPFDWVERVSVELTVQMLATLFDFPFEERHKLRYWSDLAVTDMSDVMTREQVHAELLTCAAYFKGLWDQRVDAPPANDLISMLAHGESTKDMPLMEFLGNIILLIVGGNDTTRNSITGGPDRLHRAPGSARQAARQSAAAGQHNSRNHPLADAGRAHAPHRQGRLPARWQDHQGRRQGGHVVRLRQPRRHGDREPRGVHHRPGAAAPSRVVRLRHPSLRRHAAGRNAAQDRLGGDPQALPDDRDRRRAGAAEILFPAGLPQADGSYPGERLNRGAACHPPPLPVAVRPWRREGAVCENPVYTAITAEIPDLRNLRRGTLERPGRADAPGSVGG
jgi:cytochrome P450